MTVNRLASAPHAATIGRSAPGLAPDASGIEALLAALLQQLGTAQPAPAPRQRAPHPATVGRAPAAAPDDLLAMLAALLQGQAVQPAVSPARRAPHPATVGRGPQAAAPGDLVALLAAVLQQVQAVQPAAAPGQRPPHPAVACSPAVAAPIPWPLPYPVQPYAVPGQPVPHAATVPRTWSSADAYDILAAQAALLSGTPRGRHAATLPR